MKRSQSKLCAKTVELSWCPELEFFVYSHRSIKLKGTTFIGFFALNANVPQKMIALKFVRMLRNF